MPFWSGMRLYKTSQEILGRNQGGLETAMCWFHVNSESTQGILWWDENCSHIPTAENVRPKYTVESAVVSPICPSDSLYKIKSDHWFCGSLLSSDRGSCPRCCRRHVWRPQKKLYPPGSDGTDSICHLNLCANIVWFYYQNYNYKC